VSQPVGYLFSRWNPSETNVPRGAGVGIAMAGQWKGAGGAELRSSGKRRAAGRAVDVNGKPPCVSGRMAGGGPSYFVPLAVTER
jgi:hypothetical protein